MINTYILKLEESFYQADFLVRLLQHLPEAGKNRVRDRLNVTSKLQTISGELLARYSIGMFTGDFTKEIILSFGEKGKPHPDNLSNIHFNISHSGKYVVCTVAPFELGIDVERIRKVNLNIAERFFSPSEISDLMSKPDDSKMQYFITLWTIKESYLKAIGRGLTQHLNSFTIVKHTDSFRLTGNAEAEQYGIETLQLDEEYMLAVCAPLPYQKSSFTHVNFDILLEKLPVYI